MTIYHQIFWLSGVLIAPSCFLLTAILLKYGKSRLHKTWAVFNFTVGLWGIGCILLGNSSESTALFANKFAFIFGFITAPLFYYTTLIFCNTHTHLKASLSYLFAAIFTITNLLFVGDNSFAVVVPTFDTLFFLRSTSLVYSVLTFTWFIFVISSILELIKYYKTADKIEKNKTLYFLIPMLIGFSGGSMNTFPIFGIIIYPYGNLSIPIYCAIVTYAFLRHNLTDIHIIVKKGLVYSILATIISAFYLLIIITLEKFLQGFVGYKSLTLSLAVAFTLGLFFFPIKNRIQTLVDRHILKGTPEEIVQENEFLRREVAHSEKMKAVATMASGIAHDIRGPLTAIKAFCERVSLKKDNLEFLSKFESLIPQEIGRIETLTEQLLEFAKPAPLNMQDTNIKELLDGTLLLLHNQLTGHNINVVKVFGTDIPNLKTDPNKLRQVFINLISNAADAMPHGGTLTVGAKVQGLRDTQDPKHSSAALNPIPLIIISIQDTGCGIDPKDLPHIFEPFYTKKEKGTGLGLAIVKGIIEDHKGTIQVKSGMSEGTEFTIKLPIEGAHA